MQSEAGEDTMMAVIEDSVVRLKAYCAALMVFLEEGDSVMMN